MTTESQNRKLDPALFFDVQYWNGSTWVTITGGNITGNNKVWRKISFSPVTTTKIKVLTNAAVDNGYSRITEVEAWAAPASTNVALSANGGVTSASSAISGFPASGTNNGDRKGANWGSGGGWADSSSGSFPDWLQIDFNGSKTISEVDVFTLQDNYASPSEPTETMTFSTYGLTAYDVQYWNGSAWVTVTGGSITGNNKVWRKVTFSPVTTSKIRVLTNAATDNGYSRLTEVEAWTDNLGSSGANINWLVTDQLGTPRMIFDKTGALATTKRHDYLPFGEETFAGTGARSTVQGYSVADGVRQKFTQKERDNETGLDYFLARYYSSTQGRFMSPDEFTGGPDELYYFVDDASANPTFYADLRNPQSLNKYQYTYNNPLRYTDSDGHCPEGQPCPDTSIPAMDPRAGVGAVAVDVVISAGKVAANLLTGMSNIGNIAISGSNAQLTAPFDSSSKVQDVAMHALEVLTLVSPLLAEAGPLTVMSAESRPAAVMAANEAQQLPASSRPTAAGALTTRDGQTFTVTNRGNPNLDTGTQAALDAVAPAQRSAYHGKCCEPRLVSMARRAGADTRGASIDVVKVRAFGNVKHGATLNACSSCQAILKFAGID